MIYLDDENNKDLEENKYLVEDEKINKVFVEEKTLIEDEEEIIPQNKEDYQVQPNLLDQEFQGTSPRNISKEMSKSFLEYAMSVIVSRALPDAKDGLKPVHRRILYSMYELNMAHNTPHKKSARIVGDVLGKYHPHGDSSVYEAMVRMAQNFSMRYPLIDGHGNFGSIDGDEAAAMRYTEARMSKIAMLTVENLNKNTVDFMPNYDSSDQEPIVLPTRIPNLLVNGATGIAVGMATSIPPHNLVEVIDALVALIRNPELSIQELIQFIPAPDFPTGGIILNNKNISQGYLTGRGSVTIRSKTRIETLKNNKSRIIVDEIPYQTNKARLVEKIAELVKNKEIEGIVDLRDESSRDGIRIVIELKKDVYPEVIQNKLFKLTSLQTNFSINLVSLVNGMPQTLNLKETLNVFIDHQIDVVTRRINFDLNKALDRAHILEGLKIAIINIDKVIELIKKSENDEMAINNLNNSFNLSEKQSKAIVDMRLGRLTNLAINKMNQEIEALETTINEFKNILNNKENLLNLIISELEEIKAKFSDQRRSIIVQDHSDIKDEDLIPEKDVILTMTNNGYIKRLPLEEFRVQHKGGMGAKALSIYEDDMLTKIIDTSTHTDLLIFSSLGKVYKIRTHQIPEGSKQAKGIPFLNLIDISKEEKVVALLPIKKYESDQFLLTVTKKGIVKKTPLEQYQTINKNGKIALNLRENDMLVNVMITDNNHDVIIGASNGLVVRFHVSEINPLNRTASGVKSINLKENEFVIGSSASEENKFIFSIGKNGFGKMTHLDNYRKTKRGAKGVKSIDINKSGKLKFVQLVNGDEDMVVGTNKGTTIRLQLKEVARSNRNAKGVKIISLNEDHEIQTISIIDKKNIYE